MLHHDGLVAFSLQLGHAVGERLFDARQRDAVELARLGRTHERLGSQRAAVDLAVGSQDVLAERFHELGLHRVPQKDVVAHLVEIDVRQTLLDQRLAGRGLAGSQYGVAVVENGVLARRRGWLRTPQRERYALVVFRLYDTRTRTAPVA